MKIASMTVTITALMAVFGCQTGSQGGSTSDGDEFTVAAEPSDSNNSPGALRPESATNCYPDATNGSGPTMLLGYSEATLKKNLICAFMYFIPLISPVPVDSETSINNRQQAGILSYRRQVTSRTFYVACEFEMAGEGFSTYIFDPAGAIALRAAEVKPGETLTNLLDYIRFEGAGFGGIQVRGTMDGSAATVTQVDVEFNARGRESPVTVGLYDIKAKNGQYSYANRSSEIVARVNTLTFKKSERPRMGTTVASIARRTQRADFFGQFKADVANLFIKPPKVDKLGNDTMLRFGYALLEQAPAFTFPIAQHWRQARIVPPERDGAPSRVRTASDEAKEGEPVQVEPTTSHRP